MNTLEFIKFFMQHLYAIAVFVVVYFTVVIFVLIDISFKIGRIADSQKHEK
jgi:hypothetical protein